MMGRAGRPQFDRTGVAVIMVHDPKKSFYKKFLYEPFPVESSLAEQVSSTPLASCTLAAGVHQSVSRAAGCLPIGILQLCVSSTRRAPSAPASFVQVEWKRWTNCLRESS